ncbi:MAG: hypothetical protein Q4E17_02210, partial [Synergistes sp.]|nr:hypothetical protein [Synergistes sp.]
SPVFTGSDAFLTVKDGIINSLQKKASAKSAAARKRVKQFVKFQQKQSILTNRANGAKCQ